MHYIISDIHGFYDEYMKIINFLKEDDKLIILGDIIDRGPDGVEILKDIIKRPNIELLIGNHELMMINALDIHFQKKLNPNAFEKFITWMHPCNGGKITLDKLNELPYNELKEIYDYLNNCYLIRRLKINGRKFHLSHSFTIEEKKGDLRFNESTDEEQEIICWNSVIKRDEYSIPYKFKNPEEIYIFGHTPVQHFSKSNDIYKDEIDGVQIYDIDCGMAINEPYSRIGCLRLEDLKEIYF